jgi:methylphosphotriester-DNA--protein-cysteine methyltransferase
VRIDTSRYDSPLGCGTYSEWRPLHLTGLVDVIWHFSGPTTSRYKRVLPTGRVEILVNLGDSYRIIKGAGTEVLRAAWIGGLLTSPQVIEQPARQNVLGIRMHPTAAFALLAVPMRQLTGFTLGLHDLMGRAAIELSERCAEAGSVRQLFRCVGKWISERVPPAGIDPAIAWSVGRIEQHGGVVPIAELRERTGLSKTRLAASFRDQVGVAPKLYARLIRFQRVAEMLQKGIGSLVDVALQAGFYDQPHMNAEFRELAGLAPLDFIAARHPVGDGTTTRAEPPAVPSAAIRHAEGRIG